MDWNMLMQEGLTMNDASRLGKMAFHGTMLMVVWSFMPMMLPAAYSQPTEPVPVEPVVPPPPGGIDRECRVALENSAQALSLAAVVSERVMKTTKASSPRHVASRCKSDRRKPRPFWV